MTAPTLTNYVPASPIAVKNTETGKYLKRELNSASVSIQQANTAISGNSTDITTAKGNITTLQGQVTTLQSDVTTLQSQVVANASSQSQPGTPTAPASTTLFKMQGLAGRIKPAVTGKVLILI